MEPIIVGQVTIISHDNYWKCKMQLQQMRDMLARGMQLEAVVYVENMRDAIGIFEEKYPVIKIALM